MGLIVRQYYDGKYAVYSDDDWANLIFTGNLADCEAYIRLTESGKLK